MAITATYVSSTSFTVANDHTADLLSGLRLLFLQGVDGNAQGTVVSSSYSGGTGLTTCVINQTVLTSNLATIKIGPNYADPLNTSSNTGEHYHTADDDGGEMIAAGMSQAQMDMLDEIPIPGTGDDNKLLQVNGDEDSYETVTLQGTIDEITITEGSQTKTWALASAITDAIAAALVNSVDAIGAAFHAATGKTPPVDADEFPISDSADTNDLKKVTWANIKATLKTYFDTLYSGLTHASTHIDSGSDEIDGDKLVITWTPSNSTPDSTTPAEADADDQLTAHLQGIDTKLGELATAASGSTTGTAGEVLSEIDAVYSKTTDSGEWWKGQNDGTISEADVWGIVTEVGGISNGSTGEITLFGIVEYSGWSWSTPGAQLWAGDDYGEIVDTEPSGTEYRKPLGYVIDATSILWMPQTGWVAPLDPDPYIPDPTGGATQDAESRAAIVLMIDAMEKAGIVLPTT